MLLVPTLGIIAASASTEARLRVRQGELGVVVGAEATPVERRAAELFVAEVRRRTGLDVAVGNAASAKHVLVIGAAKSSEVMQQYVQGQLDVAKLETDGLHLVTTPDHMGRLYVMGQSPSGVMAGVGKLLRLSRYTNGELEIPQLTLNDYPRMPVRGMYFATHIDNFYHVAPPEEVDRVIEKLALWGGNSLTVWFDMHHFTSLQDPAAQKHLARLQHFAETARTVGMQFGLIFLANEAYADSPQRLCPNPPQGSYGVELCPSIPEGLALIGKWQAEVLDAFGPVDFNWTWPYDQGGCACEHCKPWGGNGFLVASEQLARRYHKRVPHGKVWLST